MWLVPVEHHNGEFVGTLNNEPAWISTAKIGDELKVAKGEISYWMYVDDGKLIGGYTLRVLRDSLTEAERREFDADLPFTIE